MTVFLTRDIMLLPCGWWARNAAIAMVRGK